MTFRNVLFSLFLLLSVYIISIIAPGCAQIISPSGGPKDTIAPVLTSASPANGTLNFRGNRITLNFDEYVTVEQLQDNLLVTPTPINTPYVDYRLRSVTIRLRDTLATNTTYTIKLGNAIRDLNEGNPVPNFTYVFSTGPVIDSLSLPGKVILAETGGTDSTMFALLYRDLDDSAIYKRKAAYISRLDANGNFLFENLPSGSFRLFALKDRDNARTYNRPLEMFAFADTLIQIGANNLPVTLYAFAEQKELSASAISKTGSTKDKNLAYKASGIPSQELTEPFFLDFNKPLTEFNPAAIMLMDTLNRRVAQPTVTLDSTRRRVIINQQWPEETTFKLVVRNDLGKDSAGLILAKTDTLRFITKKAADYGSLTLRFSNKDYNNLVLQFVSGNEVVYSSPLTGNIWTSDRFKPGEYSLRILTDQNNNGKWDPGNYPARKQPERVIAISQKIMVKANWENDLEIRL